MTKPTMSSASPNGAAASTAADPARAADADESLRRVMRLNIGQGRRLSCDEVAEALDVTPRWVRSIRDGEHRASFGAGLAIAGLIGPAALNGVLLAVGYGGARHLEPAEASEYATLAHLGRGVAMLSDALADGRIDHSERPQLISMARELQDKMIRLAAQLERDGAA